MNDAGEALNAAEADFAGLTLRPIRQSLSSARGVNLLNSLPSFRESPLSIC